jgi:hypothetical protein
MMRKLLFALALLFGASPAVAQNYNATPGSGLVFGSKLVGGVNYPQIVFCDPATPANCVAVDASGRISILGITNPVTVAQATAANLKGQFDPLTAATWGLVGIAPGTAPTNALVGGLICNNGTLTPSAGQSAAFQGDVNCNLKVSVASLPLPAGAASSATQGAPTDAPATLPASATAASEIALLKAIANAANSPVPLGSASGGWKPSLLNALTTTVRGIKASAAGQLGMLQCSNSGASTLFIQLFDVATTGGVTLGTTAPVLSFEVPPGTPNGYALSLVGMQFSNGIQAAATTTATGNTAPSTLPNCNAGFN